MQLNRRLTWTLSRLWWICSDQSKCSLEASIDAQGRRRAWTNTWSSREPWEMLSMSCGKTHGSLTITFDAFPQNEGTAPSGAVQVSPTGGGTETFRLCWRTFGFRRTSTPRSLWCGREMTSQVVIPRPMLSPTPSRKWWRLGNATAFPSVSWM